MEIVKTITLSNEERCVLGETFDIIAKISDEANVSMIDTLYYLFAKATWNNSTKKYELPSILNMRDI